MHGKAGSKVKIGPSSVFRHLHFSIVGDARRYFQHTSRRPDNASEYLKYLCDACKPEGPLGLLCPLSAVAGGQVLLDT